MAALNAARAEALREVSRNIGAQRLPLRVDYQEAWIRYRAEQKAQATQQAMNQQRAWNLKQAAGGNCA
jgi:hypothetical protein